MNIFSFFATHPRLQCLSLGEKGCLANTFDILLWSRLSLCLSSKLKQLVLCQKVEQNCQTLFFIVVQRYLKVDISALVCKAMRVFLAPLFFEFLYLPVCLLKSNFVILFDAKQSWSKAIQFNSTEFEDEVGWRCPFLSCLYNT